MKNVQVYEFKDLEQDTREKIKEKLTESIIECELDSLWNSHEQGLLTEEQVYKEIGCTKYYAESTGWFVPSVYYNNYKDHIDLEVQEIIDSAVFDLLGHRLLLEPVKIPA